MFSNIIFALPAGFISPLYFLINWLEMSLKARNNNGQSSVYLVSSLTYRIITSAFKERLQKKFPLIVLSSAICIVRVYSTLQF